MCIVFKADGWVVTRGTNLERLSLTMIDTQRPRAESSVIEGAIKAFLAPDQNQTFSRDRLTISHVTGPTFKSTSTVTQLTFHSDLIARRVDDEVDVSVDPMSWEGGIIQSLVNAELGGHWDSRYPWVRKMDPWTRWDMEDDKRRESTGHWGAVEASLLPGFDAQMRAVDAARKDRFKGRKGGR